MLRVCGIVVVQSWPHQLTQCLDSIKSVCDDIVLALVIPGLSLDIPANTSVSRQLQRVPREPYNRFLERVCRSTLADACVLLKDTDTLEGAWRSFLRNGFEAHDALSLPVRTLSWRITECGHALPQGSQGVMGALGFDEQRCVRAFKINGVFDGFYADSSLVPRLVSDKPVGEVAPDQCWIKAAHRLYDQGDLTPKSAYLCGARQDVRTRPDDAMAWDILIKHVETGRSHHLAAGIERRRQKIMQARPSSKLDSACRTLLAPQSGLPGEISLGNVFRRWLDESIDALHLHQPELATELASRILSADPADAQALKVRAIARIIEGKPIHAIRDLMTALEVDPGCQDSRYNLELAHVQAGWGNRKPDISGPSAATLSRGQRQHEVLGSSGVVSFIPHLAGGAGRVAVDLIMALPTSMPQALLTLDDGTDTGQQLQQELENSGVPVISVSSRREMNHLLGCLKPKIVIAHYWPNALPAPSPRGVFKVAVSHGTTLLPERYDAYVCLTSSHARQHGYLPDERLHIIPNGIDCARYQTTAPDTDLWPSPRQKTNEAPVRIALLSRLTQSKLSHRLWHILEPLADHNMQVVVAGGGARRWQLEAMRQRYKVAAKVHFIGPIPSQKTAGFLANADIGLHVTETHHETLSIGILEMLASGLPIVSQPRGCLNELVQDGRNGYLAEDEDALSLALEKLLLDPELRATFGQASQAMARHYDMAEFRRKWSDHVQGWLQAVNRA